MDAKFKILFGVLGIIFIAWLGLFLYNRYWKNSGEAIPPASSLSGQLPYNIPKEEEKNLKSLAENFVVRYGSYTLGDFSGLEGLKDQMTSELWRKKSQWMETEKQKSAGQPRHYITFSAFSKKSIIVSYNNEKAEAEVEYLQTETKGAMIQGGITIKYVNEFGYEKPIPPPQEIFKKLRLKIIKESNEWRIGDMAEVK